ncbi:MAG: alpha/beta fold hydrolase [Pyrinomonadaceae bacterium]
MKKLCVAFFAFLFTAVFFFATVAVALARADAELIPRRSIFADEDKLTVKLSPDGKHIGYRAVSDQVMNLLIAPIERPSKAEPLFKKADGSVLGYDWALDKKHILYLKAVGERVHLFALNLKTGEKRDLTPEDELSARIERLSADRPEEVLISLSETASQGDLYTVNIKTGEREPVLKNDGFQGFLADARLRPQIAQRFSQDGGYELFKRDEKGGWTSLLKVPADSVRFTAPFSLSRQGETLYLVDNRATDTAVLKAVDLATGGEKILLKDEEVDLVPVLMTHPVTGEVQSATGYYGDMRRYFLDRSIKKDFDFLKTVKPGSDVGVAGRSLDDRVWLAVYFDGSFPKFYAYDRQSKKAWFLLSDHEELEKYPVAEREAFEIKTRDGLRFPAHLYLPAGSKRGGRLKEKLPLLIYVHGGPFVAYPWNSWFTNRIFQLLTNRGYAVLRIEFRGAGGFGKKKMNAGNLEWGGKAQNDVSDAARWAIGRGIAEKGKIGIFGWSYGGYATLAGLAFTPDEFACGVALYPVSDLKLLLDGSPGFWRTWLGDERTEEGRRLLRDRSPINFVRRIEKPLLITHGGRDNRAVPAHSDSFVEEMKKINKPVTYLYYPEEPHDYRRKENWISFFAVAERFLSDSLGGRFEAAGDDLKDVAFEVKAGENLIPGLLRTE